MARDDILNLCRDPNLSKILRDSGIRLSWEISDDPYDSNLIRLVEKRIDIATRSEGAFRQMWKDIFPETIGSRNSLDYLLDNNKPSDITLYTGFNEGAYPEWMGIKCYIDPRAEVFLKKNNLKEDIMEEYYLLQIGKIDVSSFLEKYKFSYLLVPETDYLYDNMSDVDNYKIVYNNISINEFSVDTYNEKIKYKIYKRIS